MGNIIEMCTCDDDDSSKPSQHPVKSNTDFPLKEITPSPPAKYLGYNSILPSNVNDLKLKTQNLIKKRSDNPFNYYTQQKELGAGSYGTVYRVINNVSKLPRAMKVIPKQYIANGVDSEQITNEINILRALDHPYIMRIFEFFEDNNNYYLITELCDQGDFGEILGNDGVLPEFVLKYFMKQVFESIAYLHSQHVVHGDIKRENILIYSNNNNATHSFQESLSNISHDFKTQNELISYKTRKALSTKAISFIKEMSNYDIKLADFGCAQIFNKSKLTNQIGTLYYCSPEVLQNEYREECDTWACGVMMYILLAGEPPFLGDSEEEIIDNIINYPLKLNVPALRSVSPLCKNLINGLLKKDPKERLTAAQALKHEFFIDLVKAEKHSFNKQNSIELFSTVRTSLTKGKRSKFKDIVVGYISLNFVTKEETEMIKEVFKEFSNDSEKMQINKETFVKKMKEIFEEMNEDEATRMFEVIDSDKNGTLEYQELIRALSDKEKLLCEKNLKEAFDFFDVDHSNAISWGEINEVISGGKKDANKQLMNEFLNEIGVKEDQEITFEEFCKIVLGEEKENENGIIKEEPSEVKDKNNVNEDISSNNNNNDNKDTTDVQNNNNDTDQPQQQENTTLETLPTLDSMLKSNNNE